MSTKFGIRVKESGKLSQERWTSDGVNARKVIAPRLAKSKPVVLCSHGPVIPQLVAELVEQTGAESDAAFRRIASPSTGDFSVFHIVVTDFGPHIVSVEYHEAP